MTIAVTGASGQLGHLVLNALAGRTSAGNIVALARTPSKVAAEGIEAREFDYTKIETLASGLAGVETLILISSSEIGQRIVQHRNVITAAKSAGVRAVLYTSVLHADTSVLSLADEHRVTEADLRLSGLSFTILRNGWYTENYTGSVEAALKGGAFIGSAGDGRISSAARADYAEALAVVATGVNHTGKTYELAGDGVWTLSDLAAEVSRQTGRDIPYRDLSDADYARVLVGAGLPDGLAHAIAGWDIAASQGALFDAGRQLSTLIGRPTTSLSESVAAALRAVSVQTGSRIPL
ncbi:SDR family oxidoreductase [Acetobacter sp.]|jgi:NAD(P)H dehydrogenase (quinone)|uniref:SDR family oxidoreductase n=1 Tax=Acetobacter sp. TaxID=440 RepID=UPI0025C71CD0|nr:SDR family oxidoreductase [Acetobacter sp.]MCH4092116.1 SDR family oxidoreductase [Acetobacter sp.]MCI1299967.1 SDR family oxidoreductase [Acetobacter sp.]MCI1315985.1 SDR family oxidoreductase [Acetobacter sp.]